MKTRAEVDKLKRQWILDPCWDVYETEGFEEYRDELMEYQQHMEEVWASSFQRKLENKALALNIPGNTALASVILKLEQQVAELRGELERLKYHE